jgi:flagellar hook-associated protein 3 FlgL
MGLGPILTGRIPGSLVSQRSQFLLQQHNQTLQRLTDQISTGQAYQVPSEDPSNAIQTIVLQKLLERNSQYKTNLTTNQSFLSATDDAIGSLGNVFDQATSIVIAGVGEGSTPTEKLQMSDTVKTMLQQAVNVANSNFRGRYLFAGTANSKPPFEITTAGVLFNGDIQNINSYFSNGVLQANNTTAADSFNPLATVSSGDLNPALSLDTKITDLYSGSGTPLGKINVTLDTGTPQSVEIDLSKAKTLNDVKNQIEAGFGGQVTVDIDPTSQNGLRITLASGTIAIDDVGHSRVAQMLGIKSAAAAQITGSDLDPQLSINTPISALNGGTGIGGTTGTGLRIKVGSEEKVIDLSSVTTIGDLFNEIQSSGLPLATSINENGDGITVMSRLSGADFSIGENGGDNATQLGIRTFSGSTKLTSLNMGKGVPDSNTQTIPITRRDGTEVEVDISAAKTIQDVMDAINAVDPGNLTASLAVNGNGLNITDNSGTGPLTIAEKGVTTALGIAGTESGTDNTVPLAGTDVNPQRSGGVFDLLSRLQNALSSQDDTELSKLDGLIRSEQDRVNLVRGGVGARLQLIDSMTNHFEDQDLNINETLSRIFDVDPAKAIAEFTQAQYLLQATQKLATQGLQNSILNYI